MPNKMLKPNGNRAIFANQNRMLVISPFGGDLTVRSKPQDTPEDGKVVNDQKQA